MATNAAKLPNFFPEPEKYGLYNPSEEWVDLEWGGKSMRLPGCKDLSQRPCLFDTGEPVPGTYVMQDQYTTSEYGIPGPGSSYNWKAADAIRNMLGIDVTSGKANSAWTSRGITFLPPVVDRDTFEAVKQDAERRFADHVVAWAEAEIAAEQTKIEVSKKAGITPAPPGVSYQRALIILQKRNERLGGAVQHDEEIIEESEADLFAEVKAVAMEMAEKAAKGKEIDKKELAEQLLDDPAIRKHLTKQAKWRIRKVGHLPDKE